MCSNSLYYLYFIAFLFWISFIILDMFGHEHKYDGIGSEIFRRAQQNTFICCTHVPSAISLLSQYLAIQFMNEEIECREMPEKEEGRYLALSLRSIPWDWSWDRNGPITGRRTSPSPRTFGGPVPETAEARFPGPVAGPVPGLVPGPVPGLVLGLGIHVLCVWACPPGTIIDSNHFQLHPDLQVWYTAASKAFDDLVQRPRRGF